MSRLQGGLLAVIITVLCWVGFFPVGKVALATIDPYYLTVIRYGIGGAILLAILTLREGRQVLAELRQDPRRGWLVLYGLVGFCGSGLLVFEGLRYTSPSQAAVIIATQPLMMAMVVWALGGARPARMTLLCVAAALLGSALLVSKGDLASLGRSGHVGGDLLVFVSVLFWMIYTLGARRFADWSPLRYTALSCAFGSLGIFFATAVATWLGRAHVPSPAQIAGLAWELTFLTLMASVVAGLLWNVAVKALGPLNATLFLNFIPVLVFAIAALQGQPGVPAEYLGGTIVLLALVGNNLFTRRQMRRQLATGGL